jgi:hypothetical protein
MDGPFGAAGVRTARTFLLHTKVRCAARPISPAPFSRRSLRRGWRPYRPDLPTSYEGAMCGTTDLSRAILEAFSQHADVQGVKIEVWR